MDVKVILATLAGKAPLRAFNNWTFMAFYGTSPFLSPWQRGEMKIHLVESVLSGSVNVQGHSSPRHC